MPAIIDLTSPEKALAYLRSLPLSAPIEIIDASHALPDHANDAIAAATGLSSIEWAHSQGRYVWTARALAIAVQESMATDDSDDDVHYDDVVPHDPR